MVVKEGYKNTEVGVIPEDWDCSVLGEKTIKIGSGITPRGGSSVYKEFGRPLVRSQNIGWGNLLLNDVAFIDDETHQTFQNTEINLNDVFLNISGASIGRSSFASAELVGGNVNQHVCIIRTIENQLNPVFLNLFLLSLKGQEQIDSYQSGGNRQGLNIGQIRTFKIPIPPLPEQKAIATVLSDTDNLIQALEKKIAKKELIKKGAMQQLLEPKEGWEVKALGEIILSNQLGGNYQNTEVVSKSPLIKMGNLGRGKINLSKLEYIPNNIIPNQNDILKYGDVILNTRNTLDLVGKVSIWRNELPVAYFNSNIMRLKFKEQFVSSNFYMNYAFNTKKIISQLRNIATGTTSVAAIYTRDLQNINFDIPPLEEQTHIAQILSDMDNEIELLQEKLSKYKQLKQGLMQELLTGRIRLV